MAVKSKQARISFSNTHAKDGQIQKNILSKYGSINIENNTDNLPVGWGRVKCASVKEHLRQFSSS